MPKKHVTKLASIRRSSGKTQNEIADHLGVSKATYSAWETGRTELTASHLVELSQFFNCTPNDILGYVSNPDQHNEVPASEEELVSLFRLLPPNIKSDIVDIMQTTVKGWRIR